MNNYKKLTTQVYDLLDSGRYNWIGESVEDYIDPSNCWPNAQAVVDAMIEDGDVVEIAE